MIAIGSYFVLIMSMTGTIFATLDFSPEEKNQFYEYILKEHNEYRKIHGSQLLEFDNYPIYWANNLLNTWLDTSKVPNEIGGNTCTVELTANSMLDAELARKIVADWYKTGEDYNYDIEPTSKPNKADPFTRIVWNYATEFGVIVEVNGYNLYVIAYYFYIDVIESKYKDNVFKPRDDVNKN